MYQTVHPLDTLVKTFKQSLIISDKQRDKGTIVSLRFTCEVDSLTYFLWRFDTNSVTIVDYNSCRYVEDVVMWSWSINWTPDAQEDD